MLTHLLSITVGTGVVLATSFVHMLPEAIERFGSPCLSEGWHSYHAFGGVFCMIAAFVLQWIELAAMSHLDSLKEKQQAHALVSGAPESKNLGSGEAIKVDNVEDAKSYSQDQCMEKGHVHSAGFLEHDDDMSVRSINTLLLELGIAIHSIIIGMTMGTSSEETFIVLFIALIFHQVSVFSLPPDKPLISNSVFLVLRRDCAWYSNQRTEPSIMVEANSYELHFHLHDPYRCSHWYWHPLCDECA